MNDTRRSGEKLFSQRFRQLEKIVRAVAAHRRLSGDESGELYSLVMLKIVQDDFAALRGFRGSSRWGTYLRVIVQRVLLDHRVKEWGRWRPCAWARRMGPKAVLLDRLINRDGLEPAEAARALSSGRVAEVAELERLAERIPKRPRRRLVSGDRHLHGVVDREKADRRLEGAEHRRTTFRLKEALASAIRDLPESERELLRLRFGRGWTVRRIATNQALETRPLYRRFERILHRLRQRLEQLGLRWHDIALALDARDVELELDLS